MELFELDLDPRPWTLDLSDVLSLSQSHAHDRRHPWLLHGDPVYGVGSLHGPRVVSNYDELSVALELLEQPGKSSDVGVIERRIDLSHEAERAGFGEIDAEEQGNGDECALAGGEQVNSLGALPPRCGMDVDLALQRV